MVFPEGFDGFLRPRIANGSEQLQHDAYARSKKIGIPRRGSARFKRSFCGR